MKHILITLVLLMASCSDEVEHYSCTKGTIRVLNKVKYPCTRGLGGDCSWKFYLYDGSSAYWCSTNAITYKSYNIGDTLPTLVITKTIKSL